MRRLLFSLLAAAAALSANALAQTLPPNTIHPIPGSPAPTTTNAQPANPNGYFMIHPYNNLQACLSWSSQTVTDHRVNPPVTRTQYVVAVRPCDQVGTVFTIYDVIGRHPWDGQKATNVILSSGPMGCLDNPLRSPTPPPTTSNGENLIFFPCASGGGIEPQAQIFSITVNANGAMSLASNIESVQGYANAQQECLTQVDPSTVKMEPCSGLGNWMATPDPGR